MNNERLNFIAKKLKQKNNGWSCAALHIPQFPECIDDTEKQLNKLIVIGVRFGLHQAAEAVENEFFMKKEQL